MAVTHTDAVTFAAVVLAGGAGRRLGGYDKPAVPVGGVPMLARVLAAVPDANPRIVVGPDRGGLPADVRYVLERPAGGGPVAAIAAGISLVDDDPSLVAVLAADLPNLGRDAVGALVEAVATADGAVYVDTDGRRQTLCGVWRTVALRDRLATVGDPAGRAMRDLLAPLKVVEVTWRKPGLPPWFDCDTEDDLRRAEEYHR